jgi:signal transduction histidine kinase
MNLTRYSLIFVFLLNSLTIFSQNSKPVSFKDFPIIQNLDSFDLALRKNKDNPEQYLYDLITLEKNREDYIGWYGQDLDTIRVLAEQLHAPLAMACYQYFQGFKLKRYKINSACRNLVTAIDYFEKTNDTLGLMRCYYAMMVVNPSLKDYKINKTQDRRFYWDKILELSRTTTDLQVKCIRLYTIAFFEQWAQNEQNYAERIGEVQEAINFLAQNPHMQPPYAKLYDAISAFYGRHDFREAAHKYALRSYESFKKLSSKVCIRSYLNTGDSFFNQKRYEQAETLTLQGIRAMEQLKDEEKNNDILISLYINLSTIQAAKKEHQAAQVSLNKAIDVQYSKEKDLRNGLFEELKTQAEINQKEMDNALLIQKSKAAEESKKYYMRALYIACGSLVLLGVLLYFLYQSNTKQQQLIRFRDQLFAIIAHDMRTPLTAFKGFSDGVDFLLKKGEYQNIHILSQSIDQLMFNTNLLLDNLLNWYALQSTTTKNDKTSFAVYDLVKESADLYETVAKKRKSTIEIAISDTLLLHANRNALLLIMRNLIDNAIKHSKSKKILIKASAETKQVVIEVINHTMTLPDNRLKTLQEQMTEGEVVIKEGRGLGLYLVSYFVAQHKGRVSIESSPQEGTKFKITLPLSN